MGFSGNAINVISETRKEGLGYWGAKNEETEKYSRFLSLFLAFSDILVFVLACYVFPPPFMNSRLPVSEFPPPGPPRPALFANSCLPFFQFQNSYFLSFPKFCLLLFNHQSPTLRIFASLFENSQLTFSEFMLSSSRIPVLFFSVFLPFFPEFLLPSIEIPIFKIPALFVFQFLNFCLHFFEFLSSFS